MIKKYIFIGLLLCTSQAFCAEFEKFAREFAPPSNVQKTIEDNKDNLPWYGLIEGKNNESTVFAKGNDISRIANAEGMRKVIEDNNFTTVAVPKKWIYQVNDEWRVFAEYIKAGQAKDNLTLQETQELVGLTEATGFRDWDGNILINKYNRKMTLIDTEDNSFWIGRYRIGGEMPAHCKAQYVASLYLYRNSMDDDARTWFDQRMDNLLNSEEGETTVNKPLSLSDRCEHKEIDFKKVEDEFKEIKEACREKN